MKLTKAIALAAVLTAMPMLFAQAADAPVRSDADEAGLVPEITQGNPIKGPMTPDEALKASCRYGEGQVAVDACTTIIAGAKDLILENALYYRARAAQALGRYKEAIADYDRLIDLQPRGVIYRRDRGILYELLGQYDKAIENYDRALTTDRYLVTVWFDRGFANDHLGRHDRAVADFSRGSHLCPAVSYTMVNNLPVQTIVGVPCRWRRLLPLDKIGDIELGGKNEAQRYRYRCWARAMWNQELKAAISDCEKALALNPSYLQAIDARAFVRYRMNDLNGAMQDVNLVLANEPHTGTSLYLRGVLKSKMGDAEGGMTDILNARVYAPNVGVFYGVLGFLPG